MHGARKLLGLAFCLQALTASLTAQMLMPATNGVVRLQNTDLAVLEAGDARKDLPCTVSPEVKAFLGFDLRFHAGYDVAVPLRELAGSENLLTIIFRVASKSTPSDQHYFLQRIRVPSVTEEAKGDASVQGALTLEKATTK